MTLADTTLTIGATAMRDAITHFQLHSADPGAAGTTSPLGTRVANTGSVDSDGDITWSNIAFTGLSANQAVSWVSYWNAAGTGTPATGGTFRGKMQLTGDATANAAGEYTVTSITETGTAT
jgi:hypothetical protein